MHMLTYAWCPVIAMQFVKLGFLLRFYGDREKIQVKTKPKGITPTKNQRNVVIK